MKKQLKRLEEMFVDSNIKNLSSLEKLSIYQFSVIEEYLKNTKEDGKFGIDESISLVLAEGQAIIVDTADARY